MNIEKAVTLVIVSITILCFSVSDAQAKRKAPESVPSVSHDGVKYQVVHYQVDNGHQNGGYIKAVSGKDGKKRWEALIYLVEYDADLERDVQDCFITSLRLDTKKSRLIITNEKQQLYYVDLKSQRVKHVIRKND